MNIGNKAIVGWKSSTLYDLAEIVSGSKISGTNPLSPTTNAPKMALVHVTHLFDCSKSILVKY